MDNASSKPSKASSKFSGILHRVTKVWKSAAPIGVGQAGDGNATRCHHIEDCSTEETEGSDDIHTSKIHPQPFDENVCCSSIVIPKLFDAISSLKLSYIQYQQAHIPYDPKKILSSDELIVSQLESLTKMERLYEEAKKNNPDTLASLDAKITEYQDCLEVLQTQVLHKESEIVQLGWEIEELEAKNAEMEEEIERTLFPEEVLMSYEDLSPKFSFVFETTAKAIHDFGKPFIGLMKASGWNLDQAANSIGTSTIFTQRSHKKYAFEAYLARKMFRKDNFLDDNFKEVDIIEVLRFRDPFDALIEYPNSNFTRFCLVKYQSVVHPDMEFSFFGNLDQRNFVTSGRHPRTPFYLAFVKMARWVWVLKVIAASFVPKVQMFHVKNGCEFREEQMDSVVEMEGEEENLKVAFTVIPGFRIGNNIIKCRVYLTQV